MGIIYKATCIVNGKVYIGQTTQSLQRRITNHYCGGCKHLHNAILKYGREAFVWEVLEEHDTIEELNEAEIRLITQYNSSNPLVGYNITEGGRGHKGEHPSEETRQKMREAQKLRYSKMTVEELSQFGEYQRTHPKSAEHRQKLSESLVSKPKSEAHRRALSEAWKSRPPVSEETRRKISNSNKGKTRSIESRERYREAAKKRALVKRQEKENNSGAVSSTISHN